VRETFAAPQDLVAATSGGHAVVLRRLTGQAGTASLGETLAAEVRRRLGVPVRIGIGGPATSVPELRDSYEDAAAALRIGSRTRPDDTVHAIDQLRVHQLLAAVPHRARSRFARAFVAELHTRPDWPMLRQTIITWGESGFNLVRAAAALNIHRNTLVYRLEKIGATSHPDRLALFLACLADRLDD
jgi:carbohydrate diacid regulator